MKIDLVEYLDYRDKVNYIKQLPGPVITISRDHGCDGKALGEAIIERINTELGKKSNWACLNKEILEAASKELKVSANRLTAAVTRDHENLIEDLLSSFSQHYDLSSKQVFDTVEDVISMYGEQGKVVIIGRGGAYITSTIQQALHIKLQAPLKWRLEQIQEKFGISHAEALSQCKKLDENRNTWNKHMDKLHMGDSVYDLVLNTKTFNQEQMLDIIFNAIKAKKLTYVASV